MISYNFFMKKKQLLILAVLLGLIFILGGYVFLQKSTSKDVSNLPSVSNQPGKDVQYTITVHHESQEKKADLALAAAKILESRAITNQLEFSEVQLSTDPESVHATLVGISEQEASQLTDMLIEPFTFEVMEKVAILEEADITVDVNSNGDKEGYKKTGLNNDDVIWVHSVEVDTLNDEMNEDQIAALKDTGAIEIELTEQGRASLQKILKSNAGNSIGIFVRERLMAKFLVDRTEFKDDIVISNIPSKQLAEIFADDVNVGLYVTYTPQ